VAPNRDVAARSRCNSLGSTTSRSRSSDGRASGGGESARILQALHFPAARHHRDPDALPGLDDAHGGALDLHRHERAVLLEPNAGVAREEQDRVAVERIRVARPAALGERERLGDLAILSVQAREVGGQVGMKLGSAA
jgi:hypothetical protein